MKWVSVFAVLIFTFSCTTENVKEELSTTVEPKEEGASKTAIVILGTAQDAGFPQIGCKKECCKKVYANPELKRMVTSLGLVDASNDKTYLFEASPDIAVQMKRLTEFEKRNENEFVDGIFLTHGHIGHYTGLMFLGKEATDAKSIPVFAMPRMKALLTNNAPWSLLVTRENILLKELQDQQAVQLSDDIEVTPILVPHRDEFSETVGYFIKGPNKTALFIPDIDKWQKWEKDIVDLIKNVDYAFLDATFYSGKEMNNRDISQIPHPFVIESFGTFGELSEADRNKIVFIHFNHTNPIMNDESEETKTVIEQGFRLAREGDVYEL